MIGNVVFFKKTDSLISKMIAKVTKSDYTHVALIVGYDELTRVATIIESDRFSKTRLSRIQLNEEHVVYTTGYQPKEVTDKIIRYAHQQIGMNYDYLQLVGIFLSLVFKRKRDAYFNSANKMICSELIDLAYYKAGVKRNNYDSIGNVTPQELFEVYDLQQV